jgi:hypothetical protein
MRKRVFRKKITDEANITKNEHEKLQESYCDSNKPIKAPPKIPAMPILTHLFRFFLFASSAN